MSSTLLQVISSVESFTNLLCPQDKAPVVFAVRNRANRAAFAKLHLASLRLSTTPPPMSGQSIELGAWFVRVDGRMHIGPVHACTTHLYEKTDTHTR